MNANIKPALKRLSLDSLSIGEVQRVEGIDQRRVTAMAKDFRPLAVGVITVSERKDGSLMVIDGMHRTAAARLAGYQGLLQAQVFTGLTIADEAELFCYLNTGKMPSALSRFHAQVLMGDPEATDITAILKRHGWTVSPDFRPGNVAAIQAVERVYRNGGGVLTEGAHPQLLERVIETLTIAWEWDSKSVDASMLLAIAQLFGRCGASVDTKKLIAELSGTRPAVLIGHARTLKDAQGGTVPAALAKILVGRLNKGRRTNILPEWVWIR